MAWLNAVPDKNDKRTRGERIEQDGGEVRLPTCSAPFVLGALLEIGPAIASAFGLTPIGWRDIEAWQSCLGVRLPPWQVKLLISLSREYVSFSRLAEQPDCAAPWVDEEPEARRARVARQLKAALTALAERN